jgi:membrane-associated protein
MLSTSLLTWLSSDQGLMNLLAQNWFLGVLLVAAVIFCETGLVVFPFLPGDSLLFATGAFLGMNGIHPLPAIAMVVLAAVLGDSCNYAIGHSRLGQQLVTRGWVKPRHLEKTHNYFIRYGAPTITIGRFIPIVRTIAPFLAGLSGMCVRRFVFYNILGGVLWGSGLLLAGYWLGGISWVRQHIGWMAIGIVLVSVVPVAWHLFFKARSAQRPS